MQVYDIGTHRIKCYLANDVMTEHSSVFKPAASSRIMVDRMKIPAESWFYSRFKNLSVITDGTSPKVDKIFIKKDWVDNKLAGSVVVAATTAYYESVDNYPLISLDDHEKFEGLFNVEVRGERHPDKILFNVKDIGRSLEMRDLEASVTRSTYEEGNHFRYLSIRSNATDTRVLFLTYVGLLKVLFSSRCGKVEAFVRWATNVLFVSHLGTQEQKKELAKSIILNLGASINASINTLECCDGRKLNNKVRPDSTGAPGLYLLALGYVKDLRDKLGIETDEPDTHLVVKFGMSKDIPQRLRAYTSEFKEVKDDLTVLSTRYVDSQFLNEAESEFKELVSDLGWSLEFKNYRELFVMSPKMIKFVKTKLYDISNRYADGAVTQLNNKLSIIEHRHELEMERKNSKIQVLEKDLELAAMRLELFKLSHQIHITIINIKK